MPFPVTPELLSRARAFHRPSAVALLQNFYPVVSRVSQAISGRGDAAAGITRFVIGRSLRVLPKWNQEHTPERWFYHHTVLTARRAARYKPDPKADLLVTAAGEQEPDPAYTAFVRGLRMLPQQQAEAFLLNHGEKLDPRMMSVAMDCSVEAAANHLVAATAALRAVTGDQATFEALTAKVAAAYGRLTPPEELSVPAVRREISRYLWPRRLRRGALGLLVLFLLYVGYRLVRHWL